MLEKLEILNGELSVRFDPLNTRYTVNMTTDEEELNLELKTDEENEISVFNNHIAKDKTEVVITVYNEKEMMSYYLEVYQLKSEQTTENKDYFSSLEIKSDSKIPGYTAPLIAGICFLIILLIFTFLFKKKKKY